jgi:hypothetical protein
MFVQILSEYGTGKEHCFCGFMFAQVTVGMPPANEHTITAPLPEIELRQLIHQAYGDDESTAMLTQVIFGVETGSLKQTSFFQDTVSETGLPVSWFTIKLYCVLSYDIGFLIRLRNFNIV